MKAKAKSPETIAWVLQSASGFAMGVVTYSAFGWSARFVYFMVLTLVLRLSTYVHGLEQGRNEKR